MTQPTFQPVKEKVLPWGGDGERALGHTGPGGEGHVAAFEHKVLVHLVGDSQEIVVDADPGDGVQLRLAEHAAGGVVGGVEHHHAGRRGDRLGQGVGVEDEAGRTQGHHPAAGAGQGDAGCVGVVVGLEDDDLIARFAQGEDGGGDALGGAHGHHHLGVGIQGDAVEALLVLGHGGPQPGHPGAGRVLVVPGPDGGHRRFHHLGAARRHPGSPARG